MKQSDLEKSLDPIVEVTVNSKDKDFCPYYVQEFGLSFCWYQRISRNTVPFIYILYHAMAVQILKSNGDESSGPYVATGQYWADIQRRDSILTWIVIFSVYGADTIAEVKLLISPFLLWSLDLCNQLLDF